MIALLTMSMSDETGGTSLENQFAWEDGRPPARTRVPLETNSTKLIPEVSRACGSSKEPGDLDPFFESCLRSDPANFRTSCPASLKRPRFLCPLSADGAPDTLLETNVSWRSLRLSLSFLRSSACISRCEIIACVIIKRVPAGADSVDSNNFRYFS